jgi:predicted DCC family thiol-disulfide oxidoreductase YuxK
VEPTLVYDADCDVCTWWAHRLGDRSDLRVVGRSEAPDAVRDRLPGGCCAALVTDDAVYACGAAVEEAAARAAGEPVRSAVDGLRLFADYERARERTYHWITDRCGLWSQFVPHRCR